MGASRTPAGRAHQLPSAHVLTRKHKSAPNLQVESTLQAITDYVDHTPVLGPAINGGGELHHNCVPWDVILQGIPKKHGLSIRVEIRTIVVRRS